MASRRRVATPNLDALLDTERAAVLGAMLRSHTELLTDAEHHAARLLTDISADAIAAEVTRTLREIPFEQLAARVGRQRGRGYVEPNEAAWDLIDESFEPFLANLRRLATLGHLDAAATSATGILAGLHRLVTPDEGSLLDYAGPDTLEDLADAVIVETNTHGITLPDVLPIER